MDTQPIEPNEKRQIHPIELDQNKRMKQKTQQSIANTNITDLDKDCLDHIFRKLNLNDLLNASDSSKYLKEVAEMTYLSKYARMKVTITLIRKSNNRIYGYDRGYINVSDQLSSLKLLRCFGHLIFNLNFDYNHHKYDRYCMVEQYINEYCADSLNEIGLFFAPEGAAEHFTKSFEKCKKLLFFKCNLDNGSIDLKTLFPEMRNLEICSHNKFDRNFPDLEHLSIGGFIQCLGDVSVHRKNIIEILRLNPQLKSLFFGGDMVNGIFIQSISDHLQWIETLDIKCNHLYDLDNNVIHFRNVKHFTLSSISYCSFRRIPFLFDKLKTLSINTTCFSFSTEFLEFISLHRSSLTKLCINSSDFMINLFENVDQTQFANAMELFTDIDFSRFILSIDETIDFLNICIMLKRFRFRLSSNSKIDQLLKRMSREWRLAADEHFNIILER